MLNKQFHVKTDFENLVQILPLLLIKLADKLTNGELTLNYSGVIPFPSIWGPVNLTCLFKYGHTRQNDTVERSAENNDPTTK